MAKGWETTTKQYPILKALEPMRIVQSEKGRIAQAGHILKRIEQKEAKGLYNVTYNGKNATIIRQDLETIDSALIYTRGYHKGSSGKGAKHIRIEHLIDPSQEGYVTDKELLSLGKDVREFLKYNEPFVENLNNGLKSRIYEWENTEGVRFRLVVKDEKSLVGGTTPNSQQSFNEIITFYSDRNQAQMQFKNPKLLKEQVKNSKGNKRTILITTNTLLKKQG